MAEITTLTFELVIELIGNESIAVHYSTTDFVLL